MQINVTVLSFPWVFHLRFRHDFQQGDGFAALHHCGQKLFGPPASELVDGEGRTEPVASMVSWLDPFVFFHLLYLKGQVLCSLHQNIPDLKTKVRQVTASITEGTRQKVFKDLENRLSFVVRENGGSFWKCTKILKFMIQVFILNMRAFELS